MKLILQNDKAKEDIIVQSVKVLQKGNDLTILAGHADIICAISNGFVVIDSSRKIEVQDGIVRVQNGECTVIY